MRAPLLLLLTLALLGCDPAPPQEAGPHEAEPLTDVDRTFLRTLADHHERTLELVGAVEGEDALLDEIRAWANSELAEIATIDDDVPDGGSEAALVEVPQGADPVDALRRHLEAGVELTEPVAGRRDANPAVTALAQRSAEEHARFAGRVRDAAP